MSQFAEEAPETLEEWNAILGQWNAILGKCCCEMPECPVPSAEFQQKTGSRFACGWSFPGVQSMLGQAEALDWDFDEDVPCPDRVFLYRTFTRTLTSNQPGYETSTYSVTAELDTACSLTGTPLDNVSSGEDPFAGGGVPISSYSSGVFTGTLDYDDEGTTFTYTVTLTFTNPITVSDVLDIATAIADAASWSGSMTSSSASLDIDYLFCDGAPTEQVASASVRKVRFRWVIPESWAGSYFKISWNILTEPDGWDDEEAETPPERTLSEDQTWVWSGPGDPENDDSWKSGWYEIEPPDVPGTQRVVNIRYECYRSPYGNKPQVTADAVELDPPS